MGVLVEVLRFVDVAEGGVIQPRVTHERAGQDQVRAQHDGPLRAVFRTLDGGVGGQDDWQCRVRFFQPRVDEGGEVLFDVRKNFVRAGIRGGHQSGARDPRDGDHLGRQT